MIDPGSPVPATRVFGPYRLESLLGRGGMGEVYRAYDTVKERTVALKLLPVGVSSDEAYQARFRRESQVAARLREPHIIPIHDFGEIDGQLFLDMRMVDGSDLSTLLRRDGPLDPARAVNIVGQVASALDAAHAENLVHRDVKPSNVIVAGSGADEFAYLIDFGIVHNALDTATGSSVLGSPGYTAPERLQPVPTVDATRKSVDIYALGCMLHELLTGRLPFPAENNLAMMFAHLQTPPPRPSTAVPNLPPGLDDVVARALAKDPQRRYSSAGELAAAAREALANPRKPSPPDDAVTTRLPRLDVSMSAPRHTQMLPDQARRPAATGRRTSWTATTLVLLGVAALAAVLYPVVRSSMSTAAPAVSPPAASEPVTTPVSSPPPVTTTRVLTIPAGGPLFSNTEAQSRGPAICEKLGGKFNVSWFTPGQTQGRYSMVTCTFVFEPTTTRVLDIDAGGPLGGEAAAREKAPGICEKAGGKWNRKWRDVVPSRYSVVSCTFEF